MKPTPDIHRACRPSGPHRRRGVLLLVVLSMLTLFIMLGAAFIVTATRAKEAARAYARLTFGGDDVRVPHARIADTVLLEVLRGGGATPIGPGGGAVFESLLADKYGPDTLEATVDVVDPAAGAGAPPPVLTVAATLTSGTARPTDLNGRLLTFTAPGRPATTHRILRARLQGSGSNTNVTGTAFTLSVEGPRRQASWARPLPGRAIINGREFAGVPSVSPPANEAWDGFDDHNPFLAHVAPGAVISTSTVARISFYPGLTSGGLSTALAGSSNWIPDGADNDNDGVLDGLFLDFGIPPVTDSHGNVVDIRASVLVVDLDGRFNVNAHDSICREIYTGTNFASGSNTNWTSAVATGSVPMGSGYGPAEVNAGKMFVNAPPNAALVRGASFGSSEHPDLLAISGGPASRLCGVRALGSRYTGGTNTPTPRVGVLEGRCGAGSVATVGWSQFAADSRISDANFRFALPGEPRSDDIVSRLNDRRCLSNLIGLSDTANYGIPPIWWTGATNYNWGISGTVTGTTQPLPRGVYNSPPDLHGRMKTLTLSATGSALVPRVAFAQPEWSSSTDARESKDDPYETRLDTRLGFGGWLRDPMTGGTSIGVIDNNPFTPAELEPILRPYDIDTNRLPPRLAAVLGSAAEESRLKITTDSWDTTAITGSAAVALFGTSASGSGGWLQSVAGELYGSSPRAPVSGSIGGEVSRGEKFDLNRSLVASGTGNTGYNAGSEYVIQRQAYFKDLYTLLVALAPTVSGSTLAQWAANVVEFRDADSRVFPFEYDETPQNGWQDADGAINTAGAERKVVWGAERPEIVIREAFAWRNTATGSAGMAISLHRPWNAQAYATGSTNLIDAEPCDIVLDELSTATPRYPTNQIDLGKKAHAGALNPVSNSLYNDVSGTSYPIWRLRLVAGGSTSYVRLDSGSALNGEFVLSPAITSGADKPKMDVDSTLTLVSGTQIQTGTGSTSGTARLNLSGSSRQVAGMRMPGTAMSGTVFLERLSDPSASPSQAQWNADPLAGRDTATDPVRYMVVDATPLEIVETAPVSAVATSRVRDTSSNTAAFWPPPQAPKPLGTIQNNATIAFPSPINAGKTAWLPWPNRPFVSASELMLVPQGDALEILQSYRLLTPAESGTAGLGRGAPVPLALLFDAVHVPTRFAGIHSTTGAADLSAHGICSGTSQSPAATVTANQLSSWREPGRVNLNTVVAEDVWNSVVAGALPQPIKTSTAAGLRTGPSQSLAGLLSLATGAAGAPAADTDANLPAARNPLHGIYTATRLANTTTTRSNLFAVWITIRESVANDPDSVRYRRAFYIVDRSIPVGYEVGRDNNVWDCVRVRRIIE